jgi:hypothetical protein
MLDDLNHFCTNPLLESMADSGVPESLPFTLNTSIMPIVAHQHVQDASKEVDSAFASAESLAGMGLPCAEPNFVHR